MRRHEKALEQQTVVSERCSAFSADARCGKAHRGVFHELCPADDISAGWSETAAGVFDKRAGHKVNAVFGRLVLGREFSVAVIDHYFYIGIDGLYGGADLPYLLGRESTPVLVASGALDENRGNRLISGCKLYGIDIGISVLEIDLGVIYTVKLQRAVAISFNTYCVSQCVIGQSCNRKQRVAGLEQSKKCRRKGVSAVDKAYSDKGRLGFEHLSIDLIQHFPAQIVVSVSAGARKAGIGYLVILKSRHDLYRVQLGNPVDPFKLRLNLGLDFFCKSIYLGFYI